MNFGKTTLASLLSFIYMFGDASATSGEGLQSAVGGALGAAVRDAVQQKSEEVKGLVDQQQQEILGKVGGGGSSGGSSEDE
ncbi:hypothetical protein EHEL_081835 [Encephalitozoon hellem ATCC 50504]|uniref:uncharacterized protein n=1 Tax=Encephalitozoon hellem (strain ATCC 50504) TaxID=907965 RepID=UPI00042E8C7F|nr:uncharacterized protein EHEL_081835 [Encephalitozoon hellem ATCC 50504]AHL28963.1 hypothetical protein EHEL_081835 [Encephalitozoon hellem ATCC 50504]